MTLYAGKLYRTFCRAFSKIKGELRPQNLYTFPLRSASWWEYRAELGLAEAPRGGDNAGLGEGHRGARGSMVSSCFLAAVPTRRVCVFCLGMV